MLCFAKTLRVLSCTLYETDASLVKRFAITERHKVQFRAEAYNLFNRPNFGLYQFEPEPKQPGDIRQV
jgi:hypothetical protein